MSNRWAKTLKTLNFISGKTGSQEELVRHRKRAEWAGRLATPKGDVKRRRFLIGSIPCEEFIPSSENAP